MDPALTPVKIRPRQGPIRATEFSTAYVQIIVVMFWKIFNQRVVVALDFNTEN